MNMWKYTQKEKYNLIKEFEKSDLPRQTFAKTKGISPETFRDWNNYYKENGYEGLRNSKSRTFYSAETKINSVRAYANGEGNLKQVCEKFGVKSSKQLRMWLIQYNNGKTLKATPVRKKVTAVPRKTTIDERIEVVEFILNKHHSYSEASERFDVSYQQARLWVMKVQGDGYKALVDERGHRIHHKAEEISELEKLKLENRELKAKLNEQEAIAAFEKKLNELQHRG
ncbi:hypothetical protein ABM34_11970 [Companilactobacillus ginsenosidimutans]|uniref:Insertion element IS150 protein InsJ-like helix-turn-helix domain-containing protein n=2 Tax=Companilactobacillus ginsenosidimutans TaxID=1007676 RepID=A0A0H4QMR7_9LACO|nr:hypothetical protein ABM34_02285 [Companilactobacillus ginsenosidimutans]AKP68412.1 hypothetical protein ABM34_06110 [Companilactobacillus ginsenosidimutans]AKP68416.1 hypothetical protein ABM34_06330 [Companilactobacillus ginsenosidimutans]AKP68484.1 hypothetical protein ABM34_11970 [Companilactobacillus ginsenosidimutans]